MSLRSTSLLWVGAALATFSGCQGCLGLSTSPLDDAQSTIPRACQAELPSIEAQRLDVLVVIDNSNSMSEKQNAVADEATTFIAELSRSGGIRQDFRVAVITTSVYLHAGSPTQSLWRTYPEAGRLRPVPLQLSDGGLDLVSGSERVLVGEDPRIVEKFAKMVRQGDTGSGQETPFEALRLALLGDLAAVPLDQGGNAGFLRDGARLLVVVLTDEDDCSETSRPAKVVIGSIREVSDCSLRQAELTPVAEYHHLFSDLLVDGAGRRRDILWTAIAPVGRSTKQVQSIVVDGQVRNVDCPDSFQAGERHRAMAELFDPTLANLESICQPSFRDTLLRIANLAAVSQVLEVRNIPDPRLVQVVLTRGDGAKQTCTQFNEGLEVLEAGGPAVPARFRFRGACLRRAKDLAVEVRLLCAT
jgi:hypothetical protein